MNEYLRAVFILVLCSLVLSQEPAPFIQIPEGRIKGAKGLTSVEWKSFYAYRGIPFAKPPLGHLRFAAPVKNDPWNGTLDATKDKESCVQAGTQEVGSEDCLYINVYTTDVNGSLPVMVWIHGGGFTVGASTEEAFPPDHFLEQGILFVSFNYRLGVFGFLSTEDENASGNWGIKDQVMALRWVKNNIRHFGGDPNKITVFGQSAGGASVSYLMQTNMTKGLFNRAIMQSGTSLCLWALSPDAKLIAFNVGLQLGIITLSSKSLIEHLRKANYKDLKLAENNIILQHQRTRNILAGLPFGVITEPDIPGAVFSKKSWELLSTGHFQRVPLIVGYNSNESAGLTAYVDQISRVPDQYELNVARLAPYDLTHNALKRIVAGTEIRRHFFGLLQSLLSQPDAFARFINVDQLNRPIREFVNKVSKFSTVYYYEFSYTGLLGNPNQTHKGVGHSEELPYLFYPRNTAVDKSDLLTSQRLVTLWTNFAKTGNPTPRSSSGNDKPVGGLIWEPNDPKSKSESSIKFLNISNTLIMESNPFQADWTFYQGIYDKYGDPPYSTY